MATFDSKYVNCDVNGTSLLSAEAKLKGIGFIKESLMLKCQHSCSSVMSCKHTCRGKCGSCFNGRFHEDCREPCGRTLVCGHMWVPSRLIVLDWEFEIVFFFTVAKWIVSLPVRPVRNLASISVHTAGVGKCVASRALTVGYSSFWTFSWIAILVGCWHWKHHKEPCGWSCEHVKCTRTCWEPCDRPPCDEVCKLKLICGHDCVGLCGESCPPLCWICHCEQLKEFILFGNEEDEYARGMELFDIFGWEFGTEVVSCVAGSFSYPTAATPLKWKAWISGWKWEAIRELKWNAARVA